MKETIEKCFDKMGWSDGYSTKGYEMAGEVINQTVVLYSYICGGWTSECF
jgi:hypothetical protein